MRMFKKMPPVLFFSAILGTVLEYYDYALYGFYASILASAFFPNTDPTIALLQTYGVFVVGSFAKPLGALIFGTIGDRYGRAIALKISMIGMAVPTLCIGLLPEYSVVGWWAPLMLLICRMIQGIFVSGESDGVRVYIHEWIGEERPCLANSLSGVACCVGIYLASWATTLTMNWRIPFIVGGLLGAVIVGLRRSLIETPEYVASALHTAVTSYRSYKTVIKNQWFSIVSVACLCGAVGGLYHYYLVFWQGYLCRHLGLFDEATALKLTAWGVLMYTLFMPVAGWLGDRFGPATVVKYGFYGFMGLIGMNAYYLSQGFLPIMVVLLVGMALACIQGPALVIFYSKFQISERCRSISLGHSLGSAILSGSAPLISLSIWKITDNAFAPLYYSFVLVCIGLIGVLMLRRNAVELKLKYA